MTSIKMKFGTDIRRITMERVPSYEELMRCVRHTYGITGDFVVKYEDEEFDLVTVSGDEEVRQAANYASKTSGVLRFEVFDTGNREKLRSSRTIMLAKPQNNTQSPIPALTPQNFHQLFDLDSLKRLFCNLEVSEFITKLKAIGLMNASQEQIDQLVLALQAMIAESAALLKHSSGRVQDGEVHEGVFCDGCQCKIIGVRYKCAFCFNYDLCAKCEAAGLHDQSHPRVKIIKPVDGIIEQCAWNAQQCISRYNAQAIKSTTSDCLTVIPGRPFVKTWRIRNNGTRSWPANCSLAYVDGSSLCAMDGVPIFTPVSVGQEIDIAVEMVAPCTPGRYQCYWLLKTPEGNYFGEKLWCDIVVNGTSLPPLPSFIADGPARLMEHQLKNMTMGCGDVMVVDSQGSQVGIKESEKDSIQALQAMGFTGDLLTILRKNRGDIAQTIHEMIIE